MYPLIIMFPLPQDKVMPAHEKRKDENMKNGCFQEIFAFNL